MRNLLNTVSRTPPCWSSSYSDNCCTNRKAAAKQFFGNLLLFAAAGVAPLISGCGNRSESGKVTVTGTVKWNGTLLQDGNIAFVLLEKDHLAGSGPIENGQVQFLSLPGKMRVEITASRATKNAGTNEKGPPPFEQYIPERYNGISELTAEVTLDGKNHFDFSLTEKP